MPALCLSLPSPSLTQTLSHSWSIFEKKKEKKLFLRRPFFEAKVLGGFLSGFPLASFVCCWHRTDRTCGYAGWASFIRPHRSASLVNGAC